MKILLVITFICILAVSQAFSVTNISSVQPSDVLIENKGQWDSDIKFASSLKGMKMLVTSDGIIFDYFKQSLITDNKAKLNGHVVKMKFNNSNYFFNNEGLEQTGGSLNYFIGKDSNKWTSDVRMFKKIKLNNVYNGIDLVVGFENSQPRYDFIVYPGVKPEQVSFSLEGANSYGIDLNGSLSFQTSIGELSHGRIYAYQENFGVITQIPCIFELKNNQIGFKFGDYDKSKPLIIDPLVMLSYFGGESDEQIQKIKYLKNGSFISTGWTNSTNYRTTTGAYDTVHNLQEDIFVSKFTIIGTKQTLDFSTFIGGSSSDMVKALSLDADMNIYITGWTNSIDYPVKSSFQPEASGGIEAIVSKISKDGQQLMYSSFIGGGKNDYGMDIVVGADYYAYICGYTNSSDFPTSAGTYQRANKGLDDIFLCKISPTGGSIKFSTYIGGTSNDRALGMYVDSETSVYLTGETNSGDMPIVPYSNQGTPPQPWDRPYSSQLTGGYDAFVIKITGEGSSTVNATYFGGSNDDQGIAIQVDEEYYTMYISGNTKKEAGTQKFPVTGSAVMKTNQGGWDCFYAELEKVKPQAGTGKRQNLLFSTFFGGTGDDLVQDMVWDKNSAATYFTGMTSSPKYPVIGEQGIKLMGKSDAFITKFDISGSEILYSTMFGGFYDDCGNSVAVDERGDAIICGYTKSNDFPQFNNILQIGSGGGASDAFIAKLAFGGIQILSPSGKEQYCQGVTVAVRWTSNGFAPDEKYSIEIGKKTDLVWKTIATDIQGTAFNWIIPSGFPGAKDYYIRVVTNSGMYSALLSPISILEAPTVSSFTSVPSDPTVCEGDTVRFYASVKGAGLKYSWFLDNNQFQNQSDSVLVLNTAIFNKSGMIKVSISGTCLPNTSTQEIALNIKPATKIISQSENPKVKLGKNLILFVETRGLHLKYEWFKDGKKIIGFEDSTFAINGASYSHEGNYKCVIAGDCGIVTSKDITVTIDTSTSVDENIIGNSKHLSIILNQSQDNSSLNFSVLSEITVEISIKLIDLNGSIIQIIRPELTLSEYNDYTFDVTKVPSGTYWITAECSGERAVHKIQIVK